MPSITTLISNRRNRASRLSTMFKGYLVHRQRHRQRCVEQDLRQLNDHTLKDIGLHRSQIGCVFGCGD